MMICPHEVEAVCNPSSTELASAAVASVAAASAVAAVLVATAAPAPAITVVTSFLREAEAVFHATTARLEPMRTVRAPP